MPALGRALLDALRNHGAQEIFGIPGDFVLPFFKVIEESGTLPFYTLSHEPAVGFAADAAARFHASISVAVATWGAGAFNLVNSIAGAYAERSPVVVVSGAPGVAERAAGWQLHHMSRAIDTQSRIFREITCDQAVLDDPARAPAEIARVLRSAREFSLPVYIELPRDLVGTEVEPVETLPLRPADPDALGECADEVIARLRAASRPVLMVDVETRRYGVEDKVARLARRLDLPVVTSFMGRGLLSAHPDLVRGSYLGAAGDPEITALVEDSDGLLLLGVILSDTNFAVSHRKIDMRHAILALDRKVRVGHHSYAEVPLDALGRCTARPGGREDRGVVPAACRSASAEPPAHGGRADRAVGRRSRDQRPLRCARRHADRCGYRRLPVHRDGNRQHESGRARLLRRHGLRRARRPRRVRRDRGAAADYGRRRRLPDDRVRARQLPPLWLGPGRSSVQQHELGDAARVPAGEPVQRPG